MLANLAILSWDSFLHGWAQRASSWSTPYEFPAVAKTKDHTLGGLKQQKLFVSQFTRPEVWNQAVKGLCCLQNF